MFYEHKDAHKEDVDKSGIPYIFHPFHVAEQMDTEEAVIVALLHDVVEDTEWSIDDLRHNSDTLRLEHIDEKAMKRIEKYKKAIAVLTEL